MRLIFILLSAIPLGILAQTPQVPSRMTVAGINLRINEAARSNIQEDVNMLTRSQKHYMIKVEKARTYFPIIERIFAEQGIPDDIKFLVLQESGLISDAVSTSDAVGFWQMKDFTAVELGLRVDRNIDERKNIVSSTYGASGYLKKSQEVFNNWLNSLQSYQMGIGGAQEALGDKDYGATSMTITMRTYWYVRKYLAHVVAFRGMVEKVPENGLSEYTQGAGKSYAEVARETGVSQEEIKKLNTWWHHGRLPEDEFYTVIVPDSYTPSEELVARTLSNITTLPGYTNNADLYPKIKEDKYREHKYVIAVNGRPGIIASSTDNAQTLAQKGNLSLNKFLSYNELSSPNLQAGQVYYLKRKRAKASTHYHTVKKGESLWQISQKYGIRLSRLASKNRMAETEKPEAGRIIWLRFIRPANVPIAFSQIQKPEVLEKTVVPVVESDNIIIEEPIFDVDSVESIPEDIVPQELEEAVVSETATPIPEEVVMTQKSYVVKIGDTYYSISNHYKVSVLDLLEWNQLNIKDKLSIGQKLIIYVPKTAPDEPSGDYILHTVQSGETLYSISRSYGVKINDLLKWNNKNDSELKIGEKLKVISDR